MKYRLTICGAVVAVVILAFGNLGFAYPDVGANAPPLQNILWFNTGIVAPMELRGKVVVLAFFGTWCSSCKLAIPRLNDLSRRFGGDSLVFVSLSDESPGVVATFLEESPMRAAVGCDTSGMTFEAYDIRPIPRTFLIDKKGVVAWYGHPNSITSESIVQYFKTGDVPSIALESDSLRIPELVHLSEPSFSLAVNHSQSGDRFRRNAEAYITEHEAGGRYEMEVKGQPLSEIVSHLTGQPRTRIQFLPPMEFEPSLDMSLTITAPLEIDKGQRKAVDLLCQSLGLGIRETETAMAGRTMTIGNPGYLVPTVTPETEIRRDGAQWVGNGITLGELGENLESLMWEIIWNDTSIDGKYDFVIPATDKAAMRKTLLTRYGVALDSATRPVNILVLEPKH